MFTLSLPSLQPHYLLASHTHTHIHTRTHTYTHIHMHTSKPICANAKHISAKWMGVCYGLPVENRQRVESVAPKPESRRNPGYYDNEG